MTAVKIGHGYDVHALSTGDGIVLGGATIACDKSIIAHSDGDVLIHALCDALLGALGRGDIGQLFPDSSEQNRDRNSREFLHEIKLLLDADGYCLGNADLTIVAQAPKMAPHLDAMKKNISEDLCCTVNRINIKATTTERLGFIGREEGIAAYAVLLLEPCL
jgi:2-C-methyl-D-erythritol 2,4-cyclodiphosphate synthase